MEQLKEAEAMNTFTEESEARVDNEFRVYQHRAKESAIYPKEVALTYLTMGLFGECGEVANKVKKILRGDYEGKGVDAHNKAVDAIMDECGDVMWYTSQLLIVTNVDMGTLSDYDTFEDYQTSLRKLAATYNNADEVVLQLGRSIGFLCDTASLKITESSIDAVVSIAMSVIQSVCLLTHIYNRPFTSIFTLNLDKLKVRHTNYKQQHTM